MTVMPEDQTTEEVKPESFVRRLGSMPAPRNVAAAFVGVIAYVWVEAILRLIFTYFPSVPNTYSLLGYAARDGDISAMWLTMSVVGVLAFLAARWLCRGRECVLTIRTWTWILVASAIIAPIIGEIGTPIGT